MRFIVKVSHDRVRVDLGLLTGTIVMCIHVRLERSFSRGRCVAAAACANWPKVIIMSSIPPFIIRAFFFRGTQARERAIINAAIRECTRALAIACARSSHSARIVAPSILPRQHARTRSRIYKGRGYNVRMYVCICTYVNADISGERNSSREISLEATSSP